MEPNKQTLGGRRKYRRQWRFYRSVAGREPVQEFLDQLTDVDAAAIAASMREVRVAGRAHSDVAHLRGDIWQIEIDGQRVNLSAPLCRGGTIQPSVAGSGDSQ